MNILKPLILPRQNGASNHKSLIAILIVALSFRLYGLNWDQGAHLHPDERMITMVALKVELPKSPEEWKKILTTQSTLNPGFFAYGSFPIYLLKLSGAVAGLVNPSFASYTSINLVGRFLSALFDIGTLSLLYFLGKKLFSSRVGLIAALLYSISVLPIQLSHYYAVDTLLTFFITATLYCLLHPWEKPSIKKILLVGLLFGLALATKTSALVLIIPIGVTLLLKFSPKKISPIFLIPLISLMFFLITEPFALIDFSTFWRQTMEQQAMTKDAFVFPYTLQYVGKTPYLYELKNIFLWGLGPILATLAFIGTISLTLKLLLRTKVDVLRGYSIILLGFFWIYFLVTGSFAIGFMRYMLPLYPLLCLFAASLIHQAYLFLKQKLPNFQLYIVHFTFFILLLIWPLSFMHIYSQPNTRHQASNWIYQNIPQGSTIAIEHWDDALPIGGDLPYQILQLPLYDPDTFNKWGKINDILQKTEYIIIASNRLYTPLQKLTDCPNLPAGKCYQQTADYYRNLFNGQLGFDKVTEFKIVPKLSIFNYQFSIDDSPADESFTVYDHPKIMIFKKTAI